MGRMNNLAIEIDNGTYTPKELAEMALDFDERNYTDGAWWSEMDAELHEQEMRQLESDAEIDDIRRNGYE
jgi:predicted DNA-binding helix-hairpin-helix protein